MVSSCPICGLPFELSAVDFVSCLAGTCKTDDKFAFVIYEPRPGVAERMGVDPPREFFSKTTKQLFEAERDIDTLVNTLVGGKITDGSKPLRWITAGEISRSHSQLPVPRSRREVVGVCSYCAHPDGTTHHFAMLDFRAEVPSCAKAAAKAIELIVKALIKCEAPDGAILNSGNSYHYYGFSPQSEIEWRNFMTRCLLLEPLIDVRYIAHRLLSGKATLRITNSILKKTAPYVVACFHGSRWWILNNSC